MSTLLPLASIPSAARAAERAARRAHRIKAEALEAAQYRIDVAPGCHSRPHFDPPVIGWVLTSEAAEAVTSRLTHMPGGASHRRACCEQLRPADS